MARKIVQIAAIPETDSEFGKAVALADDGSVWAMELRGIAWERHFWERMPDLPQDEDLTTEA